MAVSTLHLPTGWNYSCSALNATQLVTLVGLLLQSLVSAKDEWEEKSWSCEPIPSHHLKKAINYQWSKSYRGTAFRHYSTEKTFSWDCLGRSLPQLRCWRVACVVKKRIKSRETAGLHNNNVYEAQRVMVIRNGWKATWGLDEKTALKKKRGREISCWTETLLL